MDNWWLVKLDFQGNPVHFGEVGIGLESVSERLHSDTLFSAWVSAYAQLYSDQPNKIAALFNRFPHNDNPDKPKYPPFHLSSTFIYGHCQNPLCDYHEPNPPQKPTFYLPTLLSKPRGYPYPEKDLEFAKEFRKLKFVPLEIWHRWYQGSGFRDQDINDLKGGNGDLGKAGTFCYNHVFKDQTLPKVAVDRIHRGTNFYQTSFTYFPNQSGLYFLFKLSEPNEELFGELQSSLNFLSDEGIGGERSSGAGRFEASWHKLSPEWQQVIGWSNQQPLSYALVSLFWSEPTHCMRLVANERTQYQLQERGGWISARSGRQLRRKSVHMFTEGSVFCEPPQGQLAIVTPNELNNGKHHPIYRSGISLSLPVFLT
jgi:CRISPR-associated protein Csm4